MTGRNSFDFVLFVTPYVNFVVYIKFIVFDFAMFAKGGRVSESF